MHIDYTGKVAAVTGTSGIGLDAGLHLARLGARVFLAGIDTDLNRAAAEMASGAGLAVTVHHVDVADEASVRAWSEAISAETGHLHALVNAAAIQFYGSIEDTTPDMWDHAMAVNLRSCYLTSHILYPLMKAANGASIVHISSVQGHASQNRVAAYAATKGAIHALTRAMAVDCAGEAIRVNSVSPGSVHTPLLEFSARELATDGKSVEEMLGEFAASHPMGRIGRPADISAMIAYLCSDAAGVVPGADMLVDGGLTSQLGV